jgi:hypothetical protein
MKASKIFDNVFMLKDKKKHVSNLEHVEAFKAFNHYFVVSGENLIYQMLEDDTLDFNVVLVPTFDLEATKYISAFNATHVSHDSKEDKTKQCAKNI